MKGWTRAALLVVVTTGGCESGMDGGGFFPMPGMPPPDRAAVITAGTAPPAISGGTLLIAHDGRTAVASDPDHDVVWRVDIQDPSRGAEAVLSATTLTAGDEPGRLVEDGAGRIHVVLRRGGAVASFAPAESQDVTRTPVCPEPRGIAYDESTDRLHVACTDGDLVTLAAADLSEVRRVHLAPDLRDVVLEHEDDGDHLIVSRFRSASLLLLDKDGALDGQIDLSPVTMPSFDGAETLFSPAVAWRTLALGDGSIEVIHQEASDAPVSPEVPGGYGGAFGCGTAIVQTAMTSIRPGAADPTSLLVPEAVLAVDGAISPDGQRLALASAGNQAVLVLPRGRPLQAEEPQMDAEPNPNNCGPTAETSFVMSGVSAEPGGRQPVAVAFASNESLVIQLRDPSAIIVVDPRATGMRMVYGVEMIRLPASPVTDSGHEAFHKSASQQALALGGGMVQGSPLACASCHPEGREDGRAWDFADLGRRRTQSLAGGLLETEPFHWDGEMTHFATLMDDVFVNRMAGPKLSDLRVSAIGAWLDDLPAPAPIPARDPDAVARGRRLFHDPGIACASCHAGAQLTNNQTMDVGTGGRFQVPRLIGVSARAPYLHDGRAATLRDRFGPDGGGNHHGHTSDLSEGDLDDLVAYLETL